MAQPDESIAGGCISFLITLAVIWLAFSYGLTWVAMQDDVQSACPKSGVAAVKTHVLWFGFDFDVRCVNGIKLKVD